MWCAVTYSVLTYAEARAAGPAGGGGASSKRRLRKDLLVSVDE